MSKRELRPIQVRSLSGIRHSLLSTQAGGKGRRRPLLSAPTGSGKTEVEASIARSYDLVGRRVLVTVPKLTLVDQTVERFVERGLSVGVIQGDHWLTDYSKRIQIATVQSLQARGMEAVPKADIVLVDEAHKVFNFQREWMAHPEWQNVPFVGFSATPGTKGLGLLYDDLIVAGTMLEQIEQKILVPPRTFAPPSGLLPDLSGIKTRNTDMGEDFVVELLSSAMRAPKLVSDVVETWKLMARGRPTVVFTCDRAHGRVLQEQFCAAGVFCEYIDGKTPMPERKRIFREMEAGRVEVIVNIATMTEGVDLPKVACIVMARPTQSPMLLVQCIGRGLRSHPGKADCLVIDHTSSTERLGLVTDINWTELDAGTRSQAKAKRKDEEALPSECKKCHFIKPPRTATCPNCGHTAQRQSKVQTIAGNLEEVRPKGKRQEPDRATKQRWYGMLVSICLDRGYKHGWVARKFKEKFGCWPGRLSEEPIPANDEVRSWVKSRDIAYAKSRQKPDNHRGAAP